MRNDGSTPTETELSINRLTLRFDSPERELAFTEQRWTDSMQVYRAALIVGLFIHIAYLPVDYLVLGADAQTMWLIRISLCMSSVVATFVISLQERFYTWHEPVTLIALFINGVSMILGNVVIGPATTMYFVPGLIMVIMFFNTVLAVRFIWSSMASIALSGLHLSAVWFVVPDIGLLTNATQVLLFSTFILIAGTYRVELSIRSEYVAAERLIDGERRQRQVEVERSQWLAVIAGFVRHELRNAIAGVSSSLQLIARSRLDERGMEYVGRASRSLQFMRSFLQRVGDATSLEAALKQQETEAVDLSALLADKIEDFRREHPDRAFTAHIDNAITVQGNAHSLVQLIEKLMNNAVEHSDEDGSVEITLNAVATRAELAVTNYGDALPENTEKLFVPFVSTKSFSKDGNLGLGLYVAHMIAIHHGGQIVAEPLSDPVGARFTVSLPMHNFAMRRLGIGDHGQ